jgi:hypothetical protein
MVYLLNNLAPPQQVRSRTKVISTCIGSLFIECTRNASFMNMHKFSLTNSSVVSWSSIKVYLWSKPRTRYLRKRKPRGRINISLRAHKSSLLDTFVKVTCFTSLAQVHLLEKPRKRSLVREASWKYTCARILMEVYLCESPYGSSHNNKLAWQALRKYIELQARFMKSKGMHVSRASQTSNCFEQASHKDTCSRSLAI